MAKLNLNAKIIPGISAAGFKIGDHLSSLPELANPNLIIDYKKEREKEKRGEKAISLNSELINSNGWICVKFWSDEKNIYKEKSYYYANRYVNLIFNSKDILYCIFVFSGYKGKLFDEFEIGSLLSDVIKLFNVEFDSGDDMHYPVEESGITGIGFYAAEESLEDNPDQKIMGFCVHDWKLQEI